MMLENITRIVHLGTRGKHNDGKRLNNLICRIPTKKREEKHYVDHTF